MGGNSRPSMALVLSIQRHKVICKNCWFTRAPRLSQYTCAWAYIWAVLKHFGCESILLNLKLLINFSFFFFKDYFWGVLAYMVSCGPKEEVNWIFKIKRVFFFSFIFISWRLITLQYCSSFCLLNAWKELLSGKSKHWTSSSCFPDHLFMLCIIGLLICGVGYSNVLL